jgi:hypothetical protein
MKLQLRHDDTVERDAQESNMPVLQGRDHDCQNLI